MTAAGLRCLEEDCIEVAHCQVPLVLFVVFVSISSQEVCISNRLPHYDSSDHYFSSIKLSKGKMSNT